MQVGACPLDSLASVCAPTAGHVSGFFHPLILSSKQAPIWLLSSRAPIMICKRFLFMLSLYHQAASSLRNSQHTWFMYHGGLSCLSMKTIHKQPVLRIESSLPCTKLRTIAWKITPRNCSREAGFSAQFYVLSEQRISNKSRMHAFKASRKTDEHFHSKSVWPGRLGRESYHQRRTSTGVAGREAFNLYFQHEYSLLLVTAPLFKIVKADVQCMFDRPQRGCFS